MSTQDEFNSPAIESALGSFTASASLSLGNVARRLALSSSLPLFLLAWQLVSSLGAVNPRLFPSPVGVAKALAEEAVTGVLWSDLAMSVLRVVVGYVAGAAFGIAIGVLTARVSLAARWLVPIFQLLRPIPPIALVPVVLFWFGLSELGKFVLVAWGVFFAVWLAAHLGVSRCDPLLLRAASSMGAKGRILLARVVLPGAMPAIVIGLRTAVGISFYTLVAAELGGTFAGVAYRIDIAHQNMQTAAMFGGLVVLGVVSAAADAAFAAASRRLVFWS